MKKKARLLNFLFLTAWLTFHPVRADDASDVRQLAQQFFSYDERALQCRTKDEDALDEKLIDIQKSLFSEELIKFYSVVCLRNGNNIYIPFDIRTGDPQMHVSGDSQVFVSKIHIGDPHIISQQGSIRINYDLDIASFKQWGNFTDLTFVKEGNKWRIDDIQLGGSGKERDSYTGLIELKSLKQFLKDEIIKSKNTRH